MFDSFFARLLLRILKTTSTKLGRFQNKFLLVSLTSWDLAGLLLSKLSQDESVIKLTQVQVIQALDETQDLLYRTYIFFDIFLLEIF